MKFVSTVLLAFVCFAGFSNPVYRKLCDVNKLWLEQKDIDQSNLATLNARTETEWIQLHLSIVEKTLRQRNTGHLSAEQVQNRVAALDELHTYWHAGRFPQNEEYGYRLPIFIDRYDNFCAVGYLVKATGHEQVSRIISLQTNLAYVREMKYPELSAWANDYGFTVDELAWIQPTYAPGLTVKPLGKGTDGIVNELVVGADKKIYVGGAFKNVDSTITANNIAYMTETGGNFTWHNMGAGVNGPVYAIAEFDNKVFVAGSFDSAGGIPVNNVAYWDGVNWNPAGCTYGTIKDLLVFKGSLYAAGQFDVCAALSEVNFAKWDGTMYWQQKPGLSGVVNTMEVFKDDILLGGSFIYSNDTLNAIRWNDNSWYQSFDNAIDNEVMDFEVYKDSIYAVCKQINGKPGSLFQRLYGNSWNNTNTQGPLNLISFNTLCNVNDRILTGGSFKGSFGYFINNVLDVTPQWYTYNKAGAYWFLVDSTVNKMISYKQYIISGGSFSQSIAATTVPNSIKEINTVNTNFMLYPNPVSPSTTIKIETGFSKNHIIVRDLSGRILLAHQTNNKQTEITLPALSTGLYLVEVTDGEGRKMTQKLLVQ